MANCGDGPGLKNTRAELAGMARVFSHLAVIADPPMLKGRRRGNVVLFGSQEELPAAHDPALTRELLGGAVPAQYHSGSWVRRFIGGAQPLVDAAAS